MTIPTFLLLAVLCCLAPLAVNAQPMVVLGGGQKAQQCFMNAELAAQNLPGIGKNMLEPCDYTLEFSKLGKQDRAATFANRGIIHAAVNDFDAAMADYEAAIAMSSTAPEFYINRGNAFFMMREYANALDDYELSIELGIRQLHFVHYNMGMVFERLGNDEVAEKEYLLALEFSPGWKLAEDKLSIVRARIAEEAVPSQQELQQ